MLAVAPVESVRTSTEDLLPVVGFATRGISIHTLLKKMDGQKLPLHVALDIALSVARLIRAEHSSGRTLGALDATRVALMENGAISLVAGGQRLAPELKSASAQPTQASDVYAVGMLMMQMLMGRREDDDPEFPTNVDVPEELIALAQSCLDANPKLRPSSMKFVEKALAVHLSEAQMDEALTERVALVKQLAPELPKHLAPQSPAVIATEDITGHNLIGLRPGGGALKWVAVGAAVLLLGAGAFLAWQVSRAAPVVVPSAEVKAPAELPPPPAVEEKPAEPAAVPDEEPPPLPVKAAPARAKKHRRK